MLILLLLHFVCGNLAASTDWNYNRCDGAKGPAHWGGSCSGTQNTPINLCGATTFPTSYPYTSFTVNNWNMMRDVTVINTGYTIQIGIVDNAPMTQAGNLAALVGRGTNQGNPEWVLAQMHVHVGRTNRVNEGSEHYMQGKAYPMEIHFVHYNAAYGTSLATALAGGGGAADTLLVVGVFIEIGTMSDATLSAMANAASTATTTPTSLGTQVNLNTLFDGSGAFYSYAGGLTTPGCNEIVTWIVMKAPKTITEADLNRYKAASVNPKTALSTKFNVQDSDGQGGTQGKYGTYRPLQATNGRTVYSSNGPTDPCGTVTEPNYSCSSGFVHYPSMLVALLVVGFWATQL